MGTNYYWHEDECPHCKRRTPANHIGKSSAGWCFSLRVHPEDGINDLEDWKARWATGGVIVDEYDRHISSEEMLDIVVNRSHPSGLRHSVGGMWHLDVKNGGPTWDLCNYEFS